MLSARKEKIGYLLKFEIAPCVVEAWLDAQHEYYIWRSCLTRILLPNIDADDRSSTMNSILR